MTELLGRNLKIRSACDMCRRFKVKCLGGSPCSRCLDKGFECRYGICRAGKPKGSKNKKTLERQRRMQEAWLAEMDCSPRGEYIASNGGDTRASSCHTEVSGNRLSLQTGLPTPSSELALSRPITTCMDQSGVDTGGEMDTNYKYDCFTDLPWLDLLDNVPDLSSLPDCSHMDFACIEDDVMQSAKPDPSLEMDADFRDEKGPAADGLSMEARLSCDCVQKQAANVASLDFLQKSHHMLYGPSFDNIIKCLNEATDDCNQLIACRYCTESSLPTILSLSVLNYVLLILQAAKKDAYGTSETSGSLDMESSSFLVSSCMIGSYQPNLEEQKAIRTTLLQIVFRRSEQALNALNERILTLVARESDGRNAIDPVLSIGQCAGNLEDYSVAASSRPEVEYAACAISRLKQLASEIAVIGS